MGKSERTADEHLESARETVESIWIAIVLAFVLRAFVLEAFMIPTGSMAPRLMGKHGQFDCRACGYHYAFGIDQGKDVSLASPIRFPTTRCPNCEHERGSREGAEWGYGGDRVLVLKYLYRFREPQPWDVVVFKNPLNNEENYIKRLVGLPGQEIEIVHGDVFARRAQDFNSDGRIDELDFSHPAATDWKIPEKPAKTQEVMWQIIFDNDYQPDPAVYNGRQWQLLWQPVSGKECWDLQAHGQRVFRFTGSAKEAELRFSSDREHFYPNYAYNKPKEAIDDSQEDIGYDLKLSFLFVPRDSNAGVGLHLSSFDDHFLARVGADGSAELIHGIGDGSNITWDEKKWYSDALLARLEVGRGYEVALTHVDRRVALWLDGKVVFESTDKLYHADKESIKALVRETLRRRGRLPAPTVAILARGGRSELRHVKLMRDVYYTCPNLVGGGDVPTNHRGYGTTGNPKVLRKFLKWPDMDEFFVLGDNSPASKDSRMWGFHAPTLRGGSSDRIYKLGDNYTYQYQDGTVPRYNMMGKAFFVYWPGGFRLQMLKRLPVIPNVGRMRLIR